MSSTRDSVVETSHLGEDTRVKSYGTAHTPAIVMQYLKIWP